MAEDLVYLVTGGCGYIGEHIVKLLVTEKYAKEVRVFDISETEEIKNLSTASTSVSMIKGDITDYDQVLKATAGVQAVIHTAALVDYLDVLPHCKMEAINIGGTENILNACLAMDVPYLVYTSSITAVGPNRHSQPMLRGTEETVYTGELGLLYGKTKAHAEKLVRQANGKQTSNGKTLITCVIRPSNIYGEKTVNLVESYISAKSKKGRINYIEPKNIDQCFTYVGNVAWMHVAAAHHLQLNPDSLGGQVYYAYDDTPLRQRYTLLYELYKEIDPSIQLGTRISYWKMRLIIAAHNIISFLVKPFWTLKPFMTFGILNLLVTTFSYDTDKAYRHFGYKPYYSWAEAKLRTCTWLKQAIKGKQT
ncbi:3 beta-hydroxysteroid dehydrogenase type 7-like [Spea bombifrons]|uniref:3 beta-hydroxysteroid dehydrogenase type 7-like n=1 Tax=Spea bombifrons TaxID=233779 RepID=UPI00234A2E26|nr:3 beta-hydroxysteroid dehydrogenase type 7-like [Spea bombifrons]